MFFIIVKIIGCILMIISAIYWILFLKTNDLDKALICVKFALSAVVCLGILLLGL